MPRLIDADALAVELIKWRDNDRHRKSRSLIERWVRKIGINVILKGLAAFPTIEAESVKHGCWVGTADGYADGELVYDMWECSECGYDADGADEKPNWNYCPNCGAKMDGGTDHD